MKLRLSAFPPSRLPAFLAALLAVATPLPAASISWTTSTVVAPSDVSTAGTLVGAMNVGDPANARTINGVTFAADPTGAGPLALGSATVSFGNLGRSFNDYWQTPSPGDGDTYAAALDYGRWAGSGTGTITLGGLTPGRTYLLQLWITDTRSGTSTRVRTVDGVSTTAGGPNLATGTFIADAGTQAITLADAGSFGPQLNLLQVRDVHLVTFTTADSGAGSLRQAIADAIAAPGADTVTFAPIISGQTIALGAGGEILPTGADPITLDGSALAKPVTIDGNNASRLFSVASGAMVTLRKLIFTRGNGVSTTGSGSGGAIYSQGTLVVEDGVFTSNAVTGNGGAILNTGTALTVTRCTFGGNSAGPTNRFGGAIHNVGPTSATMSRSTFSGNSAFRGGAVRGQNASLTISQCTFTGNTASVGGALSFGGTGDVALSHVTVTGNHATGSGGVSGGGIQSDQNTGFTLENSIVSGNTSALAAKDIENQDPLTYAGANLVQTLVNTGLGSVTGPAPNPAAPQLRALGNYGGRTQTIPPAAGSPAIDAAIGSTLTTDQRGAAITGTPDIGACEPSPTISDLADLTVQEDNTFQMTVAFTISNAPGFTGTPMLSATSTDTALVGGFAFVTSGENRIVRLSVPPNAHGSATITVTVSNGLATASDAFQFTVRSVNDAPTFSLGANRLHFPNPGPQSVPGWATRLSPGPANESGQTLSALTVTGNSHPALFSVQPAIAPDGTLSYTPAAGVTGSAIVTVQLQDDGGTENNGQNSTTRTFTIALKNPLVVTGIANTGAGSLLQAVADAAAIPGGDFIHFAASLSGQSITVEDEIVLSDDLVLDATSLPGGLTLDGGFRGNRFFDVPPGRSLTLRGLTLTGGYRSSDEGNGGAVKNAGTLTLNYCTLAGNTAKTGGAIYNTGTLTMTHCTLAGNDAFSDGGAIYNPGGTLTMTQCTLIGNTAGGGGAIYNRGTLTLTQCQFVGNMASDGGAIQNSGMLTLTQCTLSGNMAASSGGAIRHDTHPLTLTQCTLSDNTARGGGAIYNIYGILSLTYCTLSGNTASDYSGGAIYSLGALALTHCTLSANSASNSEGGAIHYFGPQEELLTLTNCLIAGNNAPAGPDVSVATGMTARHGINLIGNNGTVGSLFPDGQPNSNGDYVNVSAMLSPPGNYGGLTRTMRPLAGSPALNRIAGPAFTADQRGFPIAGLADIGAYENGAPFISSIADRFVVSGVSNNAGFFKFSDAETAAADLSLSVISSNTTLVPSANLTLVGSINFRTVSLTPAAGQTGTTTITITVSDGDNTASTSFLITVLPNTPYNVWKIGRFGTNALNPALAGDTADADADGLITLLEYATLSNPLAFTASPLTLTPVPGGGMVLRFPSNPQATDLRFRVQQSTSLGTWSDIYRNDRPAGQITRAPGVTSEENTGSGRITITLPPVTSAQTFWRLRIERP